MLSAMFAIVFAFIGLDYANRRVDAATTNHHATHSNSWKLARDLSPIYTSEEWNGKRKHTAYANWSDHHCR